MPTTLFTVKFALILGESLTSFKQKTAFSKDNHFGHISATMAQYKGAAKESQRVRNLQKQRERHQEEMEVRKKKLADELKVGKMEAKFSAHYDAVEVELKSSTVGLLTVEEMKSRQVALFNPFFFASSLALAQNKLACFSVASFYNLV